MKRILFIDRRNIVGSQMAEAWFNQLAEGWARAQSCGIVPGAKIDPKTIQVMREVGIELRNAFPKSIHNALLSRADVVVMMDRSIAPDAFAPTHIWDFRDPIGQGIVYYRLQRDAIRQQVQELIIELQRNQLGLQRMDWIAPMLLQQAMAHH